MSTGAKKGLSFDISDLHPRIEDLNQILPPATSSEELEQHLEHYKNTGEVIEDWVMILYYAQYSEEER